MSEPFDSDGQDGAESYDALLDSDGPENSEGLTFEELPEVEDLTQVAGDRDEDEALALDADEFDPDAIDDADLEEDDELDYRAATETPEDDLDGLGVGLADEPDSLSMVEDAEMAEAGVGGVADFESEDISDADLEALGYADGDGRALSEGSR